jgi:group II intron reverse transcriptase/maturase
VRQLGIPTVLDRFLQQAVAQVLTPLFETRFSPHSHGFRPRRSAHDAVRQAQAYVQEGYDWAVDIDLESYFDRVNHDMLMARVARVVKDKRVLKLIRRYLESGVMVNGVVVTTEEGTPQGGPLSPLLSNIMLDDLPALAVWARGQGTAKAGAQVCTLCGRLQHLCKESSGGRAGDGECRAVSGAEVEAEGQPEEEQGGPCPAGEISFIGVKGRC